MTRAEFFSTPLNAVRTWSKPIPPEWIQEAWDKDAFFREQLTYECQREISKNGDLKGISGLVKLLSESLSEKQAIDLFIELGGGGRNYREVEWRGQFETAFAQYAQRFPPMPDKLLHRSYAEYMAMIIGYNLPVNVQNVLADFRKQGGDVNRLWKVKSAEPNPETGEFEAVEPDAEGGLGVLQLARRLGRDEIAAVLVATGANQ